MPTSRLPVRCACLGTPFPRHLCGRPVRRLKAGGGIIPSSSNPHPPYVERFLVLLRMCQHRPIVRRDELQGGFPSNQRSQSHFSRLNPAPSHVFSGIVLSSVCFHGVTLPPSEMENPLSLLEKAEDWFGCPSKSGLKYPNATWGRLFF